jgi:hypothetical protein
MYLEKNWRLVIRTLFVVSISVFLSISGSFATDVNNLPINNIENNAGAMPPSNLQSAQGLIEGVVTVDQAAEDYVINSLIEALPVYEYDGLGRVIKTTFDTGNFIATRYWGATTNKYSDAYFYASGLWNQTIQYRTDGVTIQYRWASDAHPGVDGDDHYFEYDINNKLIIKLLDDSSGSSFAYWASGNKKWAVSFDPDWSWEKTLEYFDFAGEVIHYIWSADLHIKAGDVTFQENDSLGRMVYRWLDNGKLIVTDYWGSGNRKSNTYYNPGGVWQQTIKYKEADGLMVQYHWLADTSPGTGDIVYLEYDLAGRLVNTTLDDGTATVTNYWDEYSSLKHQQQFYGPGFVWQNSVQYWADGTTMNYQWLADANPLITGDVVYEEYDAVGVLIYKLYDDGSSWHI